MKNVGNLKRGFWGVDSPEYLLIVQTADVLAAEGPDRHRRVILVVDEAHVLTPEQLEELRLLTNADFDSRTPFVGLLVGQPTLSGRLLMCPVSEMCRRI